MESPHTKSLNWDSRSKKRFRFISSKEKAKRASADVYRRYKRKQGATASREAVVHHGGMSGSKRFRGLQSKDVSTGKPTTEASQPAAEDPLSLLSESATLATELDVAMDRNATDIFRLFHRELWPLVRSLPEVLHHADRIVNLMLSYMVSPRDAPEMRSSLAMDDGDDDNRAHSAGVVIRCSKPHETPLFQPNQASIDILHLLAVLARDLRHEIHPYVHTRILPHLFSNLLVPTRGREQFCNIALMEAGFRTVAYILRYDSEPLLAEGGKPNKGKTLAGSNSTSDGCLEAMRQYYGATLGHSREVVRTLAAETFAPLIRKLKTDHARKRHLRRVLRALSDAWSSQSFSTSMEGNEEQEEDPMWMDAVDGIAHLCFEIVRGISGDFHSKGVFVLPTVLGLVSGRLDKNNKDDKKRGGVDRARLNFRIASVLIDHLLLFINHEHASDRLLSPLMLELEHRENKQPNYFVCQLLDKILQYRQGIFVKGEFKDSVLNVVVSVVLDRGNLRLGDQTYHEAAVKVMGSMWSLFPESDHLATMFCKQLEHVLFLSSDDSTANPFDVYTFTVCMARTLQTSMSAESFMRHVTPIILRVALEKTSPNKCLCLIHGLASYRHEKMAVDRSLGDTVSGRHEDDTLFLGMASCSRVEQTGELIDNLLAESSMVKEETLTPTMGEILCATARSAAFLVATEAKQTGGSKLYKRYAAWIVKVVEKLENLPTSNQQVHALVIESFTHASQCMVEHHKSNKLVEDFSSKLRSSVYKALLEHPESLLFLKTGASFCELLGQFKKYLCDDCNQLLEALIPNLQNRNHFHRLHSLRILASFPTRPFIIDHASLDLRDDLDEEPSSVNNANAGTKAGPTGSCPVLEMLLQIESTRPSHLSERALTSILSRLVIMVSTGRIPIVYAEAAASHMLGLLYWKYAPLWPEVLKTLASLAVTYDEHVWPVVQSKLIEVMFPEVQTHQDSEADRAEKEIDCFSLSDYLRALRRWDITAGFETLLFNEMISTSKEEGQVCSFEFRTDSDVSKSIWKMFSEQPSLLLKHSTAVVPVVLRFLAQDFLQQDDPDFSEISWPADLASARGHKDSTNQPRSHVNSKLVSILRGFAEVQGPEQLHKHHVLYQLFAALLAHGDKDISFEAFRCIERFKSSVVRQYSSALRDMFERGNMRDAMLRLREASVTGKLSSDDRKKLVLILARILVGRLSSKAAVKSSNDSLAAKRIAVFSFISGFCEDESEVFGIFYLSIRRYVIQQVRPRVLELHDPSFRKECLAALRSMSDDDCRNVPMSVHVGTLNNLGSLISQVGHRIANYIPSIFALVLSLLACYRLSDGERGAMAPEDANEDTARGSKIRTLCYQRLTEMVSKFDHTVDFTFCIHRLWEALQRALELLPSTVRSATKTPALLDFLLALARTSQGRTILCENRAAVSSGLRCLSAIRSVGIEKASLEFVESLLDEDTPSVGTAAVIRDIPLLLEQFQIRMSSSERRETWRRELALLLKVCETAKSELGCGALQGTDIDSLVASLLPYLEKPNLTSENEKLRVLGILDSLRDAISVETAGVVFRTLSSLLGPLGSRAGYETGPLRVNTAFTIQNLSETHFGDLQSLCGVMLRLNASDTKRLNEMDSDVVLEALGEISSRWTSLASLSSRMKLESLTPIIRTCFHLLYSEDGVVSRGSYSALRELIKCGEAIRKIFDAETDTKGCWEFFLQGEVVPLIRKGITSKHEPCRRFVILLLADIAKTFKHSDSPNLHGDLATLLCEEEPDLDFFKCITHVQIHRRSRALARLRKLVKEEGYENKFSIQSLSHILIPMALHYVYESKNNMEESIVLESVATVGALAKYLTWSKYQPILLSLFALIDQKPEKDRFLVGTLTSVLESFHFDVGDPFNPEKDSRVKNSVWSALDGRIIPKLERYLTLEKRTKKGERVKFVRPQIALALVKLFKNLGDKVVERKLPRLLTVLCDGLKNRESNARDVARTTMAKISLEVGMIYLRDFVRELTITLKEGYQLHVRTCTVHSILLHWWEQFSASRSHEDDSPPWLGTFDESVPAIMDLIQKDIFGVAQERREAEESRGRQVKEASGSKALHSLELVSAMVHFNVTSHRGQDGTMSAVYAIISPLLERMKYENRNAKLVRQIKECMSRVIKGTIGNPTFSTREALPFIYTTLDACIDTTTQPIPGGHLSEDEDEEDGTALRISGGTKRLSKLKSSSAGKAAWWLPSSIGLCESEGAARDQRILREASERKVYDGANAPKLTGSERQDTAAESTEALFSDATVTSSILFALSLLSHAIKKFPKDDSLNPARSLDPFVPLLVTCICESRDTEATLLSMKCLLELQKKCSSLSSIESSLSSLASKTLDLLINFGGDQDLLQASFRLLTFLIDFASSEDDSTAVSYSRGSASERLPLSQEQMDVLISFLRTSIVEASQHNPAMGLLRALLRERFVSAGMYDLMDTVRRQCLQGNTPSLRKQCATVFTSFILNYPMSGKKREETLRQVILNIQYEDADGRLSAIGLVRTLIEKMPDQVIIENSQMFFVSLSLQLGNDDSDECRERVAKCVSTLLMRLTNQQNHALLEFVQKWSRSEDNNLRGLSFHLLGLFAESTDMFVRNGGLIDQTVSSVREALEGTHEEWKIFYFALIALEKIAKEESSALDRFASLWPSVSSCVGDDHPWVRLASLRILVPYLLSQPHDMLLGGRVHLHKLVQNLTRYVENFDEKQGEEGLTLTVKALTLCLKTAHDKPDLFSKDGTILEDPVRWMLRGFSTIAKPKDVPRRLTVFKLFAAFAKNCGDFFFDYLDIVLEPLHRVENEARNEEIHEKKSFNPGRMLRPVVPRPDQQFAKEVMQIVEELCNPHEKFLLAYREVQRTAKKLREERKEHVLAEAARAPKFAAELKIKKQKQERERRKRRSEEKRISQGGTLVKRRRPQF